MAEHSTRSPCRHDVVIAGGGVAAAATAMRLLTWGFKPLLLRRSMPSYRAIEAIPQSALRLFEVIDASPVLKQAGGIPVENLENNWNEGVTVVKPGWFVHVDRLELARAMTAEAVKRGASIVSIESLPRIQHTKDHRQIKLENFPGNYQAALDATGRSAAWSKPVSRLGTQVADMFRIEPYKSFSVCAKVLRLPACWAYRIDSSQSVMVGVVKKTKDSNRTIPDEVMQGLYIPEGKLTYLGRQPAFPQWSNCPVQSQRLSVGDAALAHDPIAGQGISFAIASGLAAAAVVRTWREMPVNSAWADSYYQDFALSERRKHLSTLAAIYEGDPGFESDQSVITNASNHESLDVEGAPNEKFFVYPKAVRFSANVRTVGIQTDGLIGPAQVIVLPSGNSVRWLGDFDLLSLVNYDPGKGSEADVISYLSRRGLNESRGRRLVRWCLNNGVLTEVTASTQP